MTDVTYTALTPRWARKHHRRCFKSSQRKKWFHCPPATHHAAALSILLWSITTLLTSSSVVHAAVFNFEVEKRVIDRLHRFMSQSYETNLYLSNYRTSGGFPHDMRAPDRDAYVIMDHNLPMPLIYYGMEDGSISGFYKEGSYSMGYYREPGNSGYDVKDVTMAHHFRSCVNKTDGSPVDCAMSPGDQYVRCRDDCELAPCPDEQSQMDCSLLGSEGKAVAECESAKKYCPQYEIVQVPENDTAKGFIPLTNYCHDVYGRFTQEPGRAVVGGYVPSTHDLANVFDPRSGTSSVHQLGDCLYADGSTIVNRSLVGPYAYCGENGESSCSQTFMGGYESNEYDPRYRPWYIDTKANQRSTLFDPFPFFSLGMGITRTHPIYDYGVDGKQIFVGVLAVDYRLESILRFLQKSYGEVDEGGEQSTYVAIYEDKPPYYVIASSTGTDAAILVLTEDPTKPCPQDSGASAAPCNPVRIKMAELAGTKEDEVLVQSFLAHKEAGHPKELLTVEIPTDEGDGGIPMVYVSQSALYVDPYQEDFRWRVVVASPGNRSDSSSLQPGNSLFGITLAIGILGFVICGGFFVVFYSKRTSQAVMYADWRFTCAFIVNCALFNLSTLALVGPNTDVMCMVRMWSFHLLFIATLTPLFVKTYRMWRLVGNQNIRREVIGHKKAALWCLPSIAIQVVILMIVSFVDPPQQTSLVESEGGTVTQYVVCATDTSLLQFLTMAYEGISLLIGCVLAFQTRKLDARFGESKQLLFSMYTISLVAVIFIIVIEVGNFEPNGKSVLRGVGVFWATVVCSAAFVVPRLIQMRDDSAETGRGRRTVVSGICLQTPNGSITSTDRPMPRYFGRQPNINRRATDESKVSALGSNIDEETTNGSHHEPPKWGQSLKSRTQASQGSVPPPIPLHPKPPSVTFETPSVTSENSYHSTVERTEDWAEHE